MTKKYTKQNPEKRDSEESKNTLKCKVSIIQDLITMSELLSNWIQKTKTSIQYYFSQIHFWYSKPETNLKQLLI